MNNRHSKLPLFTFNPKLKDGSFSVDRHLWGTNRYNRQNLLSQPSGGVCLQSCDIRLRVITNLHRRECTHEQRARVLTQNQHTCLHTGREGGGGWVGGGAVPVNLLANSWASYRVTMTEVLFFNPWIAPSSSPSVGTALVGPGLPGEAPQEVPFAGLVKRNLR